MGIPMAAVFIIGSATWLWFGLQEKSVVALLCLNGLFWLGSFGSGYFTLLAWNDRAYSENWALLGFALVAIPYAIVVATMLVIEIGFIIKRDIRPRKALLLSSGLLLVFLSMQMILGFISG